jgi:hypothetical protein
LRHAEDSVVENCCFIVCCAEEGGGGLRTRTPTRVINCFFDRCKVKGNSSSSCDGGAIKIQTDTDSFSFSISSCTFVGCISEIGGGGAISFMGTGSLQIEHTTFFSCIANGTSNPGGGGGGLLIYSRGVSCLNCSWLNGRSNNMHGGAIAEIQDNTVDDTHVINLENCSFISNYANVAGGAIGLKLMSLNCIRCVFIHNSAVGGGSAVAGDVKYQYTFTSCVFVGNAILECPGWGGGAIYASSNADNNCVGTLSVSNSIFLSNKFISECSNSNISMLDFF